MGLWGSIRRGFARSTQFLGRVYEGTTAHVEHMEKNVMPRYQGAIDYFATLNNDMYKEIFQENLAKAGYEGTGAKSIEQWQDWNEKNKHISSKRMLDNEYVREDIIKFTEAFESVFDETNEQIETMKMIAKQQERLGKPKGRATGKKELREKLFVGSRPTITATGRYSQNPATREGLKISGGLGY